MKVYYIDSGLEGCYLVRCLLPLQENGWDGDRTSLLPEPPKTPYDRARGVEAADVVVFHRPQDKPRMELIKKLQAEGKKVVVDNDDTLKHDGNFRFNEQFNRERIARGMKNLNETMDEFIAQVTTSTEFLAAEYRKLNPNVIVLPNCIDPFLYDEPLKDESDVLRIGITGSIAVTADIDVVEPIVRHFQGNKRIKFVLFSLPPAGQDTSMREMYQEEYKFWEEVDVEWQPFVPTDQYFETLNSLRLDLMIMPRADNYFNRCKSNIKFLEASMLKIPCIGQAFDDGLSPYQVDAGDAFHMALAGSPEAFIETIVLMQYRPELRKRMGERAYKYVGEKYDIATKGHLWKEAYETLFV
jgi:glycosyltransferase involved in cell wall biosynthesis